MGKAKVTFRFDAWKEGNVAASTIEIPVVHDMQEEAEQQDSAN